MLAFCTDWLVEVIPPQITSYLGLSLQSYPARRPCPLGMFWYFAFLLFAEGILTDYLHWSADSKTCLWFPRDFIDKLVHVYLQDRWLLNDKNVVYNQSAFLVTIILR